MMRSLILFGMLAIPAWAGAQAPELPPIGGRSDPSPPPPPLPPLEAPTERTPGVPASRANTPALDLELVERVIEARRNYVQALKDLHEHYRRTNDVKRMQWAEEELKQYHRMSHPTYRLELDVPNPRLQPLYNQPEANDLYRRALNYKDKGLGTDFTDNQKRAEILLQELLTKYPQSNRISDAAYALGEIYESRAFRQFERSVAYYERCFQWNPNTHHYARLKAARVYERELKDRNRAIQLYREVLDYDVSSTRRQEASRRLYDLGAR